MTLNEVYVYLKMNGLPVTFHDDNTRIRLEGSTLALDTIVFLKVYKRRLDPCCTVASDRFVWLAKATHRDLDSLINSYLEASSIDCCDVARVKRVRSARLRYAIDLHNRSSAYRQTQTV